MQSYSEQFKRWMRRELLDNKPVRNLHKNTTTMPIIISIMPQDLIARNQYFGVLNVTTEPRFSDTNNECRFCADWRSTAIVRDDVILVHTDCKEIDLCPIRALFQRKAILFFFFDKPAQISKSPCLATSIRQKSRSFSLWVRCFKKIALVGHAE